MNLPELPKSDLDVESIEPNFEALPDKNEDPEKSDDSDEIFDCDVCFKILGSKDSLEYHKRIHRIVHKCIVCDEKFKSKKDLKDHKILHGERPFECETCHGTFTTNRGLVEHRRRHTGEKPYGCDFCDKTFRKKSNLTRHMRNCHSK